MALTLRLATQADASSVLHIIMPIIRAGTTYALPMDMSETDATRYWMGRDRQTFVAQDGDDILGTYYLMANQMGGGDHVCNCGFMVRADATGRGIARTMCKHAIETARGQRFRAMQFNFVVQTNEAAIALWRKLGFEIVGRLPGAFVHPHEGEVDALIMHQRL